MAPEIPDIAAALYSLVRQVPPGRVTTYGALAEALGDIRFARTVGYLMGKNPYPAIQNPKSKIQNPKSKIQNPKFAIMVPCHRVVAAGGALGGFTGGLAKKIALLRSEGVRVKGGALPDFESINFTTFRTDRPLEKLKEIQERVRRAVELRPLPRPPQLACGFDASYDDGADRCRVAAVVVRAWDLKPVEVRAIETEARFPYAPGYLSFRELPPIEKVFGKVKTRPDVLFIDGQGILHPRGAGIASHAGVALGLPTVGVAKSRLIGKVGARSGPAAPVVLDGKQAGWALWPARGKPVFVSPGNLVTVEESLMVAARFTAEGRRIPEPLRLAHIEAGRAGGGGR